MDTSGNFSGNLQEVHMTGSGTAKGLILGLFALVFGPICMAFGGAMGIFVGGVIMLAGIAVLAKVVRAAMSGGVAFSYDAQAIHIPKLLSTQTVYWSEITKIDIYTVTTYAYGFIKTNTNRNLRLHTSGGIFGRRKIYVPTQFVGYGKTELQILAAQFEALRLGNSAMIPAARPAPAVFAEPTQANDAPDFDADALVARYMARKKQEEEVTARHSFGRGPQSSAPAPSFGKRSV